ncbi:alpha-glucuronidase [Paenibacillus phyllosphaerae]|uniref:Xylan alpha-1,2-glucuronidase n=1 Tax=Paenibacillus phyllosphaerae TaxID=274593 RepID=A0A7W5AYF2_9BACL|nr:alpha-glucuronidase family glycosyl hydrolase [Paenibacillus phyllosphaerae]MBB3111075.1 alpha-glucuronidase [Paenibacillus phyllosphaerae]
MNGHGYQAWLQVEGLNRMELSTELKGCYEKLLSHIVITDLTLTSHPAAATAVDELKKLAEARFGITPVVASSAELGAGIRLTVSDTSDFNPNEEALLGEEGYRLSATSIGQETGRLTVTGGSPAGLLYGTFHVIRLLLAGEDVSMLQLVERPANPLRLMNQWDNADGSIERGYAGNSIFYEQGRIHADLSRVRDYARLLASVGVNGISINNVNVHAVETTFIQRHMMPEMARIAAIFRAYAIKLYLSVNFASPVELGELRTADPLENDVRNWWAARAEELYAMLPDFGGFLVKADSEHRPGPFTYGRDHADGANMLADALAPHGGIVVWRCFVYNCTQDWRDRSTDRAKAAYDHFTPLDGRFRDNVVLQIKNGPMDFQVREPVSPLLGAMPRTNQIIEFQAAQEYTGQQRHLCYLVPQWKEALSFETYAQGEGSTVSRAVSGQLHNRPLGGIASVSNIGDDAFWTGHPLAQANLYGYGRLAWNPQLTSEEIADEWTKLTFGSSEQARTVIHQMLMSSWPIYESYTAPLGVGWMVTPHTHYGPDVDGYEYSRWGTYHFADRSGIGVNRTTANGTGYTAQYREPHRSGYESVTACPDELLLFFHHVPYEHRLHSGKTIIQHIYDTHFEGAEAAAQLLQAWTGLEGFIDSETYARVQSRHEEQAAHATHWRDVINTYFYRKSGIADERGRKIY